MRLDGAGPAIHCRLERRPDEAVLVTVVRLRAARQGDRRPHSSRPRTAGANRQGRLCAFARASRAIQDGRMTSRNARGGQHRRSPNELPLAGQQPAGVSPDIETGLARVGEGAAGFSAAGPLPGVDRAVVRADPPRLGTRRRPGQPRENRAGRTGACRGTARGQNGCGEGGATTSLAAVTAANQPTNRCARTGHQQTDGFKQVPQRTWGVGPVNSRSTGPPAAARRLR